MKSQQGKKAGFTVIGANLPCSCLQCLTGDQEQTKAGTGGEPFQEALVNQLAHKAIGFLGALNRTSRPPCSSPCSRLFATPRLQVSLLIEILPSTSSNTSVISPCPSRASPLLFGKLKGWRQRQGSPYTSSSHTPSDVLPTLTARRWLCTTLIYNTPLDKPWPLVIMKTLSGTTGDQTPCGHPKCPYNCSGYRLLHWSPRLAAGSNKLPPEDVCNVIRVAAALSYYVARQVCRNQESSKLLLLTPHNDTVNDLIDALGLPADSLPPSLYEFYLVMIYRQQILFSSRIYTHRP